jgi:hypothetical protein
MKSTHGYISTRLPDGKVRNPVGDVFGGVDYAQAINGNDGDEDPRIATMTNDK